MQRFLIHPDVLVVLEEQGEGQGLQEGRVHPLPTLLVELQNVSGELWLLFPGSLHILVQILIKEV